MKFFKAIALAVLIAGCANPTQAKAADQLGSLFGGIQDRIETRLSLIFAEASKDLHLAIDAGELPPDDPATPCVDGILADLGIKPGSGPAYTTDTIGGRAAVDYIKFQKIQKSKAPVQNACEQIIGKFVIDAAKNAPIGGSMLK